MTKRRIRARSGNVVPAFGNGFLDSAFSALRREMEFFDMCFDNENIETIYDKKFSGSK